MCGTIHPFGKAMSRTTLTHIYQFVRYVDSKVVQFIVHFMIQLSAISFPIVILSKFSVYTRNLLRLVDWLYLVMGLVFYWFSRIVYFRHRKMDKEDQHTVWEVCFLIAMSISQIGIISLPILYIGRLFTHLFSSFSMVYSVGISAMLSYSLLIVSFQYEKWMKDIEKISHQSSKANVYMVSILLQIIAVLGGVIFMNTSQTISNNMHPVYFWSSLIIGITTSLCYLFISYKEEKLSWNRTESARPSSMLDYYSRYKANPSTRNNDKSFTLGRGKIENSPIKGSGKTSYSAWDRLSLPLRKRLHREMNEISAYVKSNSHLDKGHFIIGPQDINQQPLEWTAILTGPQNTPYANGSFAFHVVLPENYPFAPPKIKCNTRLLHWAITNTGIINISICKRSKWGPNYTLLMIMKMLFSLFQNYAVIDDNYFQEWDGDQYEDTQQNYDLLKKNKEQYDVLASKYTERYAF